MARGIRLLKAEREFLKGLLAQSEWLERPKLAKTAASILQKVVDSETAPAGVPIAPIEAALIAATAKVVALEAGHDRASKMAATVKANPEQAKVIGEWMQRTHWLHGPQTVLDVLNKWYQWLPKARATEPPKLLAPGLGPAGAPSGRQEAGDVRQGPGTPGQASPKRGTAPGFR